MWTKFFDMASGGLKKTDYEQIYIELPEDKARKYFEYKFERDPDNITCNCCGRDFLVYEVDEEPTESNDTLIIRKDEIHT